jgi:hypothetical protein
VAANVNNRPDLRDADFVKYFKSIVQLSCAFNDHITPRAFVGLRSLERLDVRDCYSMTPAVYKHLPALKAVCLKFDCGSDRGEEMEEAAGDRLMGYWDYDSDEDGWARQGERCTECPNMPDGRETVCRRTGVGWANCVCDEGEQEEVREYLCSECRAPRACPLCGDWECRACLDFDDAGGDIGADFVSGDIALDIKPCAACGDRVCRYCAWRCDEDGCQRHWCARGGKDCYGTRKGYECVDCQQYSMENPEGVGAGLCNWACDECARKHKFLCFVCENDLTEQGGEDDLTEQGGED